MTDCRHSGPERRVRQVIIASPPPGDPMNAVDSHAHVFCDKSYAFSSETLYHPHPEQMGTAKQFRAVLDFHGFTHGLLVGAGPYGSDNRCMLAAIAASQGRFKGVALVKPTISDADLASLKDNGV